jgi:hypothetical protein
MMLFEVITEVAVINLCESKTNHFLLFNSARFHEGERKSREEPLALHSLPGDSSSSYLPQADSIMATLYPWSVYALTSGRSFQIGARPHRNDGQRRSSERQQTYRSQAQCTVRVTRRVI